MNRPIKSPDSQLKQESTVNSVTRLGDFLPIELLLGDIGALFFGLNRVIFRLYFYKTCVSGVAKHLTTFGQFIVLKSETSGHTGLMCQLGRTVIMY